MKPVFSSNRICWAWCALTVFLGTALLCLLDQNDQAIALRTLSLGFFTSLIAIPLGVLLAATANGRGVVPAAARTFCLVGVLIPVFVHVTAWDAAFGKLGLLTSAFGQVLEPVVARWPAAVWLHAMIATPQVAVLFLIAYRSGSASWEDALSLETRPWIARLKVLQWRFSPVVVAAMLWAMIGCAREIGVTDIYQIGTLAEQVYLGYSLGQLNAMGTAWTPEQLAAAENLGTGITLLIFVWLSASAMFAFLALSRSVEHSESKLPSTAQKNSMLLNTSGVLLLLLLVAVPVANLIGRVGFVVRRVDGQPVASWDAGSAIAALQSVLSNFQDEFLWSLLIAMASASLVLLIAIPSVWFCGRSLIGKLVLAIGFATLASVPGPSLGLLVGWLFNQFDIATIHYLYDRTILAPVIANVLFCLPIAIPIFWFLATGVSLDQQEQALLEGASATRQMVYFGFLGPWRANLGAWFLIAALSFGELSATQMVLPPGIDTVPRLALGMLHAGVNESTAALTLVTLVPVLVLSLLAQICFAANRRIRLR